jgi:hypothetical protein
LEYLESQGIDHSPAAVKSQFQNPVEREVQTVNKGVSTLFADQHLLSSYFWPYALNHWILAANATPINGITSPVELVTGRSIDISRMFRFPFGCPLTSTKEQPKVAFPGVKSEIGISLGAYAENDRTIRLYVPGKGISEFPRLNVQLLKTNFPPHQRDSDLQPVYDNLLNVDYKSPVNRETVFLGTHGFQHFTQVMDDLQDEEAFPLPKPPEELPIPLAEVPIPQYWTSESSESLIPTYWGDDTTSSSSSSTDSQEINWLTNHIQQCFSITPRNEDNPTMAQALRNWDRWSIPSDKEMTMLKDLDLYEEVDISDVPKGYQILPTKMDFKTKFDSRGIKIKDKCRLVVLGNLEFETLKDYFSPTAHTKTLNLLLALAVEHKFIMYGLDIYGAFITAEIDEPVYVSLPKGLPIKNGTKRIRKLKKTLYGLKRSPKAFYDSLSAHLLSKGYVRSDNDPCLFYRRTSTSEIIMFCIHVDDFAIAASHQHLITALCDDLKQRYVITESDTLESFLGIRIHSTKGGMYLSQPGHLQKIFDLAKTDFKTKSTPMSADFSDEQQDDSPKLVTTEDAPEHKSLSYFQSLLGMIMFVVRTRPDIAFAVNRLAVRTAKATEKDLKALRRIAAYLYGSRNWELVYAKGSGSPALYAYSDASFVTHPDGKSHMGFCIGYGSNSGFFFSRSAKQKLVTLSSTESETYSATETAKDVVYFRNVLEELGFPTIKPTSIKVDNQSLIALATKFSGNHKRVRHFLSRINYLIEQVDGKVITLDYIDTKLNTADQLTKPLSEPAFVLARQRLMGPQRNRINL